MSLAHLRRWSVSAKTGKNIEYHYREPAHAKPLFSFDLVSAREKEMLVTEVVTEVVECLETPSELSITRTPQYKYGSVFATKRAFHPGLN